MRHGGFGSLRPSPRVRRGFRTVVLLVVLVVGLSTVLPVDAVPAGQDFPLAWLWSWIRIAPAWSQPGGIPAQETGTAAGKAHYVAASATDAHQGAGRAPGRGVGALPPYEPPTSEAKQSRTPHRAGDHSFDPKTSTRIASAATATSDTYQNADGSYTRHVHDDAVNYKAADGSWRPIDPTLTKVPGDRYRQASNSATVDVAGSAADPELASVSIDADHSIAYSLAGATKAAASVSGDTATYRDVLPGTDLSLTSLSEGVKEALILHSADAPTSWLFPLDLKGLTPTLETNGSVALRDAAGKVRAQFPAGSMHDSTFNPKSGDFDSSNAVTYKLDTTAAGEPALRVSIDADWLRDPKRTFPVTVDPTTTWDDSGDTFTLSTETADHSGSDELRVGTWNGGGEKAYSFMHFTNFQTAYAGAKMSSVSLKIFDSWAWTCTAEPFSVNPITAAWDVSVSTYPGPSFGAAIGSVTANPGAACTNTAGNRSVGTWMSVPLSTTTFQNWALGRATNNGLAITASQTDSTQWKKFTSRNGPTGLGPYLSVTYTPDVRPQVDAQYPPSGYSVPSLTPELLAAAHDQDKFPDPLTYDFAVFNSAGTKIVDSGWVSSRNWVVPAGKLTWSQDYRWTVTASDGYLGSTSQTTNVFSTPVPQPLITSGLAQNGDQGFEASVGNYTTAATDATVPTVGPPLTIDRAYNTQDPRLTDAFGAGWSTVADAKATEQKDTAGTLQTVIVTYPAGQEVAFGRNADGSFSAPSGRFATFTAITGGYKLVDKDGTAYTFTTATGTAGGYGISSIADAQGRTETFGYDTFNRLSTITSASGRALHLTWATPTGASVAHVDTVFTDPATPGDLSTSYTWKYLYSGDLLTSACPPTNWAACLTYTYTTGSQYPSAVMNAGPRSYWRLAETSGTVAASEVLDNQGTDNASYSGVTFGGAGPLPGLTATAPAFNGTSSYVKLPGTLVSTASYQSIGMWFKANAGDSGPLFTYQAGAITAATTTGNYTPALYIGTSGKLYGKFWDAGGTNNMASAASVADGKWHHVVLAGAGDVQWLYLDGTQIGTRSSLIGTINAYSATNEYVGAGFLGGSWVDEPHYNTTDNTGYRSYFKGSIGEVAFYDRPLTAANVTAMYKVGKAAAAPLSAVKRPSGNATVSITYDTVSGKVNQVTDSDGGAWKINKPAVSGSYQGHSAAVLSAGPADYWRLAESGTADAVNEVNGNTATYNNVTLGVAGGPFDDPNVPSDNTTVASLDGSSSYLALPSADVPTTCPCSISMWFKAASGAIGPLFGYQADPVENGTTAGNYTPALYVGTSGKLHGKYWNSSQINSTAAVTDGKWHHVVLAASGTGQSMYLDGALVGSSSGTIAAVAGGTANAYVGAGFIGGTWPDEPHSSSTSNTGYATYFKGQIAEVALYGKQLSAAQVAAQYGARASSAGLPAKTVTITDPTNKTITHVYDLATGRDLAETDALGNKAQYGYDTGGFLRTVTDPNGNVTTDEHDVRGNTVSETSCQDRSANKCSTVYFTYYPDATTKVLTPDPRNDVMLTQRDGRSTSATDTTYLTSYTYDAKGNRTQVTDPLGRKSTIVYTDGTTIAAVDAGFAPAGLPYTVTTPGGAVQKIDYFANGDVAKMTDPAGKVTSYAYDGLGRVTSQTETTGTFPNGLVTSFGYDQVGRVISQTEPATTNRVTGAVHTPVTTAHYNDDGLVDNETISDATGGDAVRTESNTYNAQGLVATTTDAAGKVTRFEYDPYGNQTKEFDADGGEVDSTYDAEGRMLTETMVGYTGDPNNPGTPRNLVTQSNAYDPAGRLASETDAMGWVTSYTYTDNGLQAATIRTDPNTGDTSVQESNAYDAAGNPVSQTGNNGLTTTTFAVDAAGRTTSSTLDPNGLKRTSTFEYNADDYQVAETVSDPTGVLSKSETMYDSMGREIAHTRLNGTTAPVARWKLNESSGSTAKDSAGNSPATGNAGVTWSAAHGGSAAFDGTTGRMLSTAPAVDTARSFTVSAWVDLTDSTKTRKALGALGNRQNSFDLRYDDTNRWEFVIKQSDTDNATAIAAASTSIPALNTWTHLTGVYDQSTGTIKLYVNGALEDTDTTSKMFTATGPFRIGSGTFNGSLGNFWQGGLADVQLYQRALTDTEVASVYGGTAPAADAGVIRTSQVLDQDGLETSVVDPAGNVTNYSYDEAGQQTVITAPTVNTETNGGTPVATRAVSYDGYDTFGEQTESKDPNGNVTVTAYDPAGRVSAATGPSYLPPGSTTPLTPVTRRAYDTLGQLTSVTDPLGKITSYAYDQLGNVAKVTAPDLSTSTFTYDANGDQLSATDANGAVSTATYDYLGHTKTATDVVRQDNAAYTTTYTYDSHGFLASVKTPSGVTSSAAYNAAGEPVTLTDAAGNITRTTRDGLGRAVRTTLPDNTYTTTTYDMAGRPTGTGAYDAAGALQASTSTTFDALGQIRTATDARGTTTTYGYDATGLLSSVNQPISASDSITTSFGYDIVGNRTRFTDGRGNPFITTYNSWGLPESTIEPATTAYPAAADRTFTASYDLDGRVSSMSSPGGVNVTYSYDDLGQLTRQGGSGAEAVTVDRTFSYDPGGRVTAASGSAGTENFTYDDRDALRSATGTSGNSSFTYNSDGEKSARTDAAGTTNYTYDVAGRLATVSNAATAVQATYSYNSLSQVNKITYGTNGNHRDFGYDALHRLTSDELKTPASTSIAKITYGYNANGDETSKATTGFSGSSTNTYTYDLADRLTSWDNGSTVTAYAYDKSGNRTQAGNETFTYDQRNQLATGLDNATGASTAYRYTPRGTLASVTGGSGVVNTQADAFNEITRQEANSTNATTYTYDGLGRAIMPGFSYTGADNDLAGDGAATYTRDPDGDLMGVATSLTKTLAWTDQHDDVVAEFGDTATTMAASMTYDPLGKAVSSTGMLGHLGYQSEWTDSRTGRVNMLARWYDPDTGQFDTRDAVSNNPVPDSINANRFQYASANPLTNTDPTGHWSLGGAWKAVRGGITRAYHATTSFVSSAWNSASSRYDDMRDMVRQKIAAGRRYVAQKVSHIRHAVSHYYHKAVHYYHAARHWAAQKYHQVRHWAAQKYHQAKRWVKHKVAQGRRWAAHQYHRAKEAVKHAYHRIKQAGRTIVAKASRVVHQTAHAVRDAYKATAKFVKEHKQQIIEVAAIVGGIAAGLACTAATAGAGAVACIVGATALINVAKDAAEGNIHSLGDALGSLGTGAVQGALGAVTGGIGGKVAGALVGKLGSVAGSIGGRMLAGGIAGGVADTATQMLTTGHVNLAGLGLAIGIGAVTAGRARNCHSFDPNTRVAMADGTTRAIKDVNVGDKVKATDPKTGTTAAKSVTMLHRNKDTDLAKVTVRTPRGVTTLNTTQNHPFWDATDRKWVAAAELKTGHKLRNIAGAALVAVLAVTSFHGKQTMDDLTVADTHTYYVLAGTTPVLVHNCGTGGAAAANDAAETTTVGRWMSQEEFDAMSSTGRVQEGAGGRTYVVRTGNPDDYTATPPGSVFARFGVPKSSLKPASKPEWAVIPGPNVTTKIYGPPPAEMPPATCIVLVCRK